MIGAHCSTPSGGSSGLLINKTTKVEHHSSPYLSSKRNDDDNNNNNNYLHDDKLFFVAKEEKDLNDQDSAETSSQGSTDNCSTSTPNLHHSPSPDPFIAGSDVYTLDLSLSKLVGKEVYDVTEYGSMASFVNSRVENGLETNSFLVTNLASIINQYYQWQAELPMVEPFYAVKCNPDPVILRLLASLGCSFDCATMGEIDLVINGLGDDLSFGPRGKASSSIVYANPAKMEHMLRFAVENNVRMTVFDGEDELYKIASIEGSENLSLLLRLTTDDKSSVCRFSKKFGCPVDESYALLEVAQKLGLHVAGVSFHVGSGCGDSAAYTTALEHARRVFDHAEKLGMRRMHIIDLGGGFPGDTGGYGGPGMPTFQDLAKAIREGIQSFGQGLSQPLENIRFIAEPGRYFVSASTAIVTRVYSRKGGCNGYQALYVDDGVYGSFNNVVYDHAHPIPQKLSLAARLAKMSRNNSNNNNSPSDDDNSSHGSDLSDDDLTTIPSAVFGPTCDGLDQMCSLEETKLPRCRVGDWLLWENNGAYTHTASFVFNGYTHIPSKSYCIL